MGSCFVLCLRFLGPWIAVMGDSSISRYKTGPKTAMCKQGLEK